MNSEETMTQPGSPEWLSLVQEEIIDPDRPIVDPHHHLWEDTFGSTYLLEDLLSDTGAGHNVEQTVFVECRSHYREAGPEHLRPVGETEFVAAVAKRSAATPGATIAGIVAHADLTLGDALEEVLNAHEAAGSGLFRGIRHAGARAEHPEALMIAGNSPKGLYEDPRLREGVRVLGRRGLTYDTWHYHYQNDAFAELARAVPDTIMILDHFGTPLGVGPYADKRETIFEHWKTSIAEIARCPNVVAKLGGMAMPDNGFGWHARETPPTSEEFAAAQRPYYLHTIECFGPERCMFESNFPVDRLSIAYPILYNGFKRIVYDFSVSEKDAMFSGTARRVYRL
jgi:predicted TIM-barrel fold metal-dependent hydrolase